MTTQVNPSDNSHIGLEVKRAVDAVCDRFEEAWLAGQQPRIEDFLGALSGGERGYLFRELLATELALCVPVDFGAARDRYLARFPEYRNMVHEMFADPRLRELLAGEIDAKRAQIMHRVRQQLPPATSQPSAPSEESCTEVRSAFTCDESRLAGNLWDSLIGWGETMAQTSAVDDPRLTENIRQVIEQLLNAFPVSRRHILQDLLNAPEVAKIAQQHGVTERTVLATLRAAADLVANQSND